MTQVSAREMFVLARVARLATVSPAGEPHLVPVTFAVIEPAVIEPVVIETAVIEPVLIETAVIKPAATEPDPTRTLDAARPADAAMIVFAVDHKPKSTTALRRLDNIAANPRVAFLVDGYDEDWDKLWWVRADADATILAGELRLRALIALAAKYVQYERVQPSGVVVGAVVNRWAGWKYSDDGTGPPQQR